MASEVMIAGFTVFPEIVDPDPQLVGGDLDRALDGTGYRKIIGEKDQLTLVWGRVEADEYAYILAIWEQAKIGAVTITCSDPVISGSFILANKARAFKQIEGEAQAWTGALVFAEV